MKKLLFSLTIIFLGCSEIPKPVSLKVQEQSLKIDSLERKIRTDSIQKSTEIKINKMLECLTIAMKFEAEGKIDSGKKYRDLILKIGHSN